MQKPQKHGGRGRRDLGNDYTYDDVNGLQVRADAVSLFLTNKTAETIYYLAVEQVALLRDNDL